MADDYEMHANEKYHSKPQATEGTYGGITTEAACYRPLDTVTVRITGRASGDDRCAIRVCDPEQRQYFETETSLTDNRCTVQFQAGGLLGTHYVYLSWPGEERYSRYINFYLDCATRIESGDTDFDDLYRLTHEAMLRGRREYSTPSGKFVGYMSADTWRFDGIWLRDWIYGLPAYRFWELDMTCGLDRFLEQQHENGMIPDGIERSGETWRVGMESDVEYILVMGVWQTWQVTGDNSWLAAVLPRLERALAYIRDDEKHWDRGHRLVKRQHSCDTWDFDIDGVTNEGKHRHVIATCDQSGYVLAFDAMSRMYAHLGDEANAGKWRHESDEYRKRANELLWDGTKYLHHVHLDDIDHGNFDETEQLAMGNTWAMTRGLASADQARSIIDEYRRRHARTGDAFPWWSLQPGYPDDLGYFSDPETQQGGYANGGLMPWVGGELCRASFLHGRESYGVDLLRAYVEHLKNTGGAHVWYWPDGEAGFRTTNEVPYATWGMAEWLNAAGEGLAGIHDSDYLLRAVACSPRWTAAGVRDVKVTVRYAASKAYFAYDLYIDESAHAIRLTYTGSGKEVNIRILLPEGWVPKDVTSGDSCIEFNAEEVDVSRYACFSLPIQGCRGVTIDCAYRQGEAQ